MTEKYFMNVFGGIDGRYVEDAVSGAEKGKAGRAQKSPVLRRTLLVAAVVMLIGAMIFAGVMLSRKDKIPETPEVEEHTEKIELPRKTLMLSGNADDKNVNKIKFESFNDIYDKILNEYKQIHKTDAAEVSEIVFDGMTFKAPLYSIELGAYEYRDFENRVSWDIDAQSGKIVYFSRHQKDDVSQKLYSSEEILQIARKRASEEIDISKYTENVKEYCYNGETRFEVTYNRSENGINYLDQYYLRYLMYGAICTGYSSTNAGKFDTESFNELKKNVDFGKLSSELFATIISENGYDVENVVIDSVEIVCIDCEDGKDIIYGMRMGIIVGGKPVEDGSIWGGSRYEYTYIF